jgi:hypothetical protein
VQTDDIGLPRVKDEDGQLKYNLDVHRRRPGDLAGRRRRPLRDGRHRLDKDGTQAFLLDYFYDRLAFPDQLDKIREWFLKWRPEMIGIESNAYQRALVQMTARMDGLPPVVAVFSKSKKEERILGLGPLFKIGKVRIQRRHVQFIDQWVSFDPAKKNGDDDLLDAVEIALGVAGVLLPQRPLESLFGEETQRDTDARGSRVAAGARREEP